MTSQNVVRIMPVSSTAYMYRAVVMMMVVMVMVVRVVPSAVAVISVMIPRVIPAGMPASIIPWVVPATVIPRVVISIVPWIVITVSPWVVVPRVIISVWAPWTICPRIPILAVIPPPVVWVFSDCDYCAAYFLVVLYSRRKILGNHYGVLLLSEQIYGRFLGLSDQFGSFGLRYILRFLCPE